jgi:VanZ family protein
MRRAWSRSVARGVAIAWTAGIFALLWSPPPPARDSPWWADEAVHGGLLFGFAIAWSAARARAGVVAAAGVAISIVTELVQPLLPWPRTAQVGDVVSDAGGLAIGLALVWLLSRLRTDARTPGTP